MTSQNLDLSIFENYSPGQRGVGEGQGSDFLFQVSWHGIDRWYWHDIDSYMIAKRQWSAVWRLWWNLLYIAERI